MRRLKKTGFLTLMLFLLALLPAMSADAGFGKVRVKENGRYRYYYRYYTTANKKKYIKGKKTRKPYQRWVFLNIRKNGKVSTYCFDEKGYMQVGWKKLTTKACGGKWYWYYFDNSGKMLKNRTKNGHYLQGNGRMLTNGWHNEVYYGANGVAIADYKEDVKSGFQKDAKGTKYLQPDGNYAEKKWLCIKDSTGKKYWYYFYSTGYMAKNAWVGSRHVDENGRMDKQKKY